MKYLRICLVFAVLFTKCFSFAQNADTTYSPFFHGVSSGDPLTDRVILWTRITEKVQRENVALNWRVSTDPFLEYPVISGTINTSADRDYTVKVDAYPLEANSWYYYGFECDGKWSPIGRTRTLPLGDVDSLRFAVVSCQDYQNGFYNAYNHLAARNDVDAVFHLGDFIYENPAKSTISRLHVPATEAKTLSEYRMRYSQYKQDADLIKAMQAYPFICIWDDHEFANDSHKTGSPIHKSNTPIAWENRISDAARAFNEWLPIRNDYSRNDSIYRSFVWGNLAETFFLETRVLHRDQQVLNGSFTDNPILTDTCRQLLGEEQMQWLQKGMLKSNVFWKVIAQPIMFAPLLNEVQGKASIINSDLWDGYPAERARLMKFVEKEKIKNIVFLSGDQHTGWANEIPLSTYASDNCSMGVEFVTTSISSKPTLYMDQMVKRNKHILWGNVLGYGYLIVDFNVKRVQADFYSVNTINNRQYVASCLKSFMVEHGQSNLLPCKLRVTETRIYPPLPPSKTDTSKGKAPIILYRVYKQNTKENTILQFHLEKAAAKASVNVINSAGFTVIHKKIKKNNPGMHSIRIDTSNLDKGDYIVQVFLNKRKKDALPFIVE